MRRLGKSCLTGRDLAPSLQQDRAAARPQRWRSQDPRRLSLTAIGLPVKPVGTRRRRPDREVVRRWPGRTGGVGRPPDCRGGTSAAALDCSLNSGGPARRAADFEALLLDRFVLAQRLVHEVAGLRLERSQLLVALQLSKRALVGHRRAPDPKSPWKPAKRDPSRSSGHPAAADASCRRLPEAESRS